MIVDKQNIFLEIKKHKIEIEKFGVKRLGLFGSASRNENTSESDIDFLVEFLEDKKSFDNFMDLAFYLENLFNNKIDLITTESLDKIMKHEILNEVKFIED